jgi:hypothetical protein
MTNDKATEMGRRSLRIGAMRETVKALVDNWSPEDGEVRLEAGGAVVILRPRDELSARPAAQPKKPASTKPQRPAPAPKAAPTEPKAVAKPAGGSKSGNGAARVEAAS